MQMLQSIPAEGQSAAVTARIDLRSGMNQYRLRNWKQAEKSLVKAAGCSIPGIRSEARFWLAKTVERQGLNERAYVMYMELAAEGKKQEFADDALMEAAGLRSGSSNPIRNRSSSRVRSGRRAGAITWPVSMGLQKGHSGRCSRMNPVGKRHSTGWPDRWSIPPLRRWMHTTACCSKIIRPASMLPGTAAGRGFRTRGSRLASEMPWLNCPSSPVTKNRACWPEKGR
jgi:hypothetical protein